MKVHDNYEHYLLLGEAARLCSVSKDCELDQDVVNFVIAQMHKNKQQVYLIYYGCGTCRRIAIWRGTSDTLSEC